MSDRSVTSGLLPDSGSPIDLSVLDQLFEDVGLENAEMLIDTFLEEMVGQVRALEDAAASSDLDAIARTAHRLKGSTASFGATQLNSVVVSIERAARAGQQDQIVAQMDAFRTLAQASEEAMRIVRHGISAP